MARELRISLFSLDGIRLFDWRTPKERRSPIFGAATRPGDISRAIFRLRNEDVGPITDLFISWDSRFVASVEPRRFDTFPMGGESTISVDFTLPRDYAFVKSGRTSIAFRGTVTGWI